MAEEKLSGLCDWIKRGCDAHTGITAGTFYRDEGWCFYQLGAAIECADQTTRLLDAKFLNFMAQEDHDPGSAADSFYWMALLRSAAGYQAFRRRHPRGMAPEQVAAFLLSDPCFPRSVACCLGIIEEQLTVLRRFYGLRAAGAALEFLDGIRDDLEVRKVKAAIGNGELHRFDDFLQRSFNELTGLIANALLRPSAGGGRADAIECRAGLSGRPATDDAPRGPPHHHLPLRAAGAVRPAPGDAAAARQPRPASCARRRAGRLAARPKCAGCTTCSATRSPCSISQRRRPSSDRELDRDRALRARHARYPIAPDAENYPFAYGAEDRADLGPTCASGTIPTERRGRGLGAPVPGRDAEPARSSC